MSLYLGVNILHALLLRVLEVGIYLGDKVILFTVNHNLGNKAELLELLLYRLGGDVFAAREDYQVLDSAGDEELSVLGDIADIACLEPAVLGEHLRSSGIL